MPSRQFDFDLTDICPALAQTSQSPDGGSSPAPEVGHGRQGAGEDAEVVDGPKSKFKLPYTDQLDKQAADLDQKAAEIAHLKKKLAALQADKAAQEADEAARAAELEEAVAAAARQVAQVAQEAEAKKRERAERVEAKRLAKQKEEQEGCRFFCDSINSTFFERTADGTMVLSPQARHIWRSRRKDMTPELLALLQGADPEKEAKQAEAREKAAAKQAKQAEAREKAAAKLTKWNEARNELVTKLDDAQLLLDAARDERDKALQAQEKALQMVGDVGNDPSTESAKFALKTKKDADKLVTDCQKVHDKKAKAFESSRQALKALDTKIFVHEATGKRLKEIEEAKRLKKAKEAEAKLKNSRKRKRTDISSQ